METKEEAEFRANERKNRELRDEMRRGARQAGASPATMRKLGEQHPPFRALVSRSYNLSEQQMH